MTGTGADFALLRLGSNGAADGTFGSSGEITTDFYKSGSFNTGSDTAYGVAIDPSDGTIVAGGTTTASSTSHIALARYLSSNAVQLASGALVAFAANTLATGSTIDGTSADGTPAPAATEPWVLLDRLLKRHRYQVAAG